MELALSLLTKTNKCLQAIDNALSKEMRLMTIIVKIKAEQKECGKILTVEFPK